MTKATTRTISQYKVFILSLSTILIGIILLYGSVALQSNPQTAEFLQLLGTIFVPSGVISLANEYFLRESFKTDMKEELKSTLEDQFRKLQSIETSGIKEIHSTLPQDMIVDITSKATTRVRILQTWIPDLQVFEMAIANAAHSGAEFQILILNPDSSFAYQRALDLGYKDGNIGKQSIRTNILDLERITTSHSISEKIEVRIYNQLPSVHMYSVDEISFVGFFWHGVPSKLGYGFEVVGSESGIGLKLHQEFDRIWKIADKLEI